ncbi:type I-E CRISPR-associated protein Cas5/CasD [Vibrio vulnificus]|uniref:type I-E CRISPR-associated protein Cas5/CasD n=1 Tax=Vibrio vulnificus TaxID=672 RepID=UPI00102B5C9D|nr:type I-E CRISPR-associated protein Cas5/CasD [Vibrio vulnificus]EIA0806493.1 type I-E CRISPR-associated protein Cas5/CasD [Vibrio vulnificus]EJN6713286.1 type I-E CRISPR-associated protein Cas5/CasD [Vibrio vulnificus]MCU8269056.1 type I-E CRISPR-associated protein Cas5/CasD [Vibrio vulnificus]RZR41762.1 type I-E CRISPR-associated protein Cas5/CasD [Vibrio vulnificus]
MTHPYILMWLEGPLQSWGYDSRYGRRDTLSFPTKSGVLGIICAALGAGGEQKSFLTQFASLDMQVLAFPKKAGDATPAMPLSLQDFHMVGSGYDEKDPWQSLLIPKTSQGKKAVGGGAKMTYRHYIQDMAYAVLLQVPEEIASAIADALVAPVWDLSLGRKSCVPTEFIYQGTYHSDTEGELQSRSLADEKDRALAFQVRQGAYEGGEVLTLNDVPLQFGENKRYRDRQVTVIYCQED